MKRSLSAISNSNENNRGARARVESGSEEDEEPNGFFLKHQNKALARELHGYKRRIKTLDKKVSRLTDQQKHYDATLSCVNRSWDQLDTDLNMVLAAAGHGKIENTNSQDASEADSGDENDLLTRLLKSGADYAIVDVTYHPALNGPDDGSSKALRKVEESLQKRLAFTQDILKRALVALKEAKAQEGGLEAFQGELMASKRKLKAKCLALKDQLSQAHTHAAALNAELEAVQRERNSAMRRLDKLRAEGIAVEDEEPANDGKDKAAAGGASVGAGADSSAPMGNGLQGDSAVSSSEAEDGASAAGGASEGDNAAAATAAAAASAIANEELEALREARTEAEALSVARLAETEALREEKVALEARVTALVAEAAEAGKGGEEKVRDEALALRLTKLQEKLVLEQGASEAERQRRGDLERAVGELASELRGLESLVEEQAAGDRRRWEAKLKEAALALGAAQAAADKLRHRCEQASAEARRAQAIRAQVEEHRALHRALQAQAQRAKADAGRAKGALDHERAERKKRARKIAEEAEEAAKRGDAKAAVRRAAALQEEGETLRRELRDAQAMNDGLIAEVEALSTTFEDLTSQSARLLAQLGEKEDAAARLTSAHLKLEQQLAGPAQEAVRRADQRARAAEQAARLQEGLAQKALERERALEQKVWAVEEERREAQERLGAAAAEAQREKDATAELGQKHARALDAASALRARCQELAAAAERAEGRRRRAQEERDALQRRAEKLQARGGKLQEALQRQAEAARQAAAAAAAGAAAAAAAGGAAGGGGGGGPGGQEAFLLQEEVRELKKQLRCSVCQDRRKDVTIAKCFHTFCRPCVEENLRTRNRKCPACGRGFGQDDVHAIWLT